MAFKQKVANIGPLVEAFLRNSPHLRDDNERLVAAVWTHQLRELGYDPKVMAYMTFLERMCKRELSQAESITRASRRIQEAVPELRGEFWEERQREAQETRKTISK